MMIIASVTRKSGVFEYLAIWSAKPVKASPAGILAMLAVVTTVASALLDNVTFFIGLFMVIAGVEHTGALRLLANKLVEVTGGDLEVTGLGVMWSSAVLSAIVDNIPFVATMIPMIKAMAPTSVGRTA
jgi:Na+/H+ antiporter NhaD/arsenite permease-like protein